MPIKPSESERRVTWGIRSVVMVGEGGEGGVGEEEEGGAGGGAMVASWRFGLK